MVAFTKPDSVSFGGTIAAVDDIVVLKTQESNCVSVALVGGTFSTVACTFEVSWNSTNGTDGVWIPVQAGRNNANTLETTTGNLSSLPAYFWVIDTSGAPWFRIRCTGMTSGSQTWAGLARAVAMDMTHSVSIANTLYPVITLNTNGPTMHNLVSAAGTNATSMANAPRSLLNFSVSNLGSTACYVKLFNKASAPTVGTDVPVLIIPVPAGGVVNLPIGPMGQRFSTGIAYSITAQPAVSDTTAVAAGDVRVLSTISLL